VRAFTGTGHMMRLILRRDRIWLPVWILGNVAITWASAVAVQETYDDPQALAAYESTVGDSAATLITAGRNAALGTLGGVTVNETSMVATVVVALMVLFTVVRHTRTDEETGRTELLRAGVLGRHAPTLAAVVVAVVAAVATGGLIAVAMVSTGLATAGSVAYGAAIAMLGIAFAGSSAVAAQLSTTARGALGIGGLVIGGTFVLRGIGAVQDNWLTWTGPFGWAQEIHPYADERWWVLPILLGAALLAFVAAAYLTAHRDVGGGVIQPRAGAPRAQESLSSPVGMALRLQRGMIIGWGTGLVALAAIYGSVVVEVPELLESTPEMAEMFGGQEGELIDAFLGYIFLTLAVTLSCFSIASVLRLRSEEAAGRVEALLATALGRGSWAAGVLTICAVASMVLMAVVGLTTGVTYAATADDWSKVGPSVAAALNLVPAVLVMIGATFALWGWTGGAWGWALLAFVAVQTLLGELLGLPDWLSAASPFWHVPQVPSESAEILPLVVLTAVALGLLALGFLGLRRRDIRTV
jgi:ABC-2 type transport system permease protein